MGKLSGREHPEHFIAKITFLLKFDMGTITAGTMPTEGEDNLAVENESDESVPSEATNENRSTSVLRLSLSEEEFGNATDLIDMGQVAVRTAFGPSVLNMDIFDEHRPRRSSFCSNFGDTRPYKPKSSPKRESRRSSR